MRLRPTPVPKTPVLDRAGLTAAVERWLGLGGVYRNPTNRRSAAENLTFATLRVMRGSEITSSAAVALTHVSAETSARRLRRAAALFTELADRLED
jgi:hypothetical protein